jgi:hypothetical protein
MQFIENHNTRTRLRRSSYLVRMNQFGDLTLREYLKFVNGFDRSLLLAKKKQKILLFTGSRFKNFPPKFGKL